MKTEKKLKQLFQKADSQIPIRRPDHFRIPGSEDVSAPPLSEYHVSRFRLIFGLLRYMDKRAWAAYLVISLFFAAFPAYLHVREASADDMTVFLMLSASILGSVSILVLSRLFAGGLAEIACTCFFNPRQLAAFQILALGILNLTVLAFLILFTGIRWGTGLFWLGIYTAVPFVFTAAVCLWIMRSDFFRGRSFPVLTAGLLCAGASLVFAAIPHVYQTSAAIFWGMVLAAELTALAAQIRHLFTAIDGGEILCTD